MASIFSTKLQIPRILLSQSKRSSKFLVRHKPLNLVDPFPSNESRSIWSWLRKSKAAEQSGRDMGATTCGRRLPERLKPCNPECPSRCIEFEKCRDNEAARMKLTNCREPEGATKPNVDQASIFGTVLERKKTPDPCTCVVLNRQKRRSRERDPRLRDPRYEMTAGDVFVFTEHRKSCVRETREPLPQPPPSYKLPRAVFTQKFVERAASVPNTCATAWKFEESCDSPSPKCTLIPEAPILPYEELRPPETRRTAYSCKNGARPEVVAKPPSNQSKCCGSSRSEYQRDRTTVLTDPPTEIIPPTIDSEDLSSEMSSAREKSRFEQLKKLTRAKESRCCELFTGSNPEKANCGVPSCKMSTWCRSQQKIKES